MAILIGDLRMALVEAGAREDIATKAGTEVATYKARLAGVETRLSVLTWMAGANLGPTILLLGSALTMGSKLGEVGGRLAQIAHAIP